MKVLLTGASGQVGTEFLRLAQGLELLAPTRQELDLSRTERLRPWLEHHRPDILLSVGAYTAVDQAEVEAPLAQQINADAVAVLSDYASAYQKALLQLSTDYVFDGSASSPYRESDPTAPLGVYGRSKFAGEQAARATEKHVILRTSWVFAAHGRNFVRTMLRLGCERDRLKIVDDQIGGPTWAGHLAQALKQLTDRLIRGETLPWGTWHYGGTPHLSWHDFAAEVLRQAHARGLISRMPELVPIHSDQYPTPARRPANSRLDCKQSVERLQLLTPDWHDGLRQTLDEIARSA